MSFFQDLDLYGNSGSILNVINNQISESMSTAPCSGEAADECRDDAAAMRMKAAAIAAILVAGAVGVGIPLVGRKRRVDGGMFVLAKAFAAGVILATGFVHMLHDAQAALTSPCLPKTPWRKFPFSGFVAMLAALLTLAVDFVGTQFYERKHGVEEVGAKRVAAAAMDDEEAGLVDGEDVDDGDMNIVVAAHSHRHGHGHAHGDDGHVSSHVRHAVISQILELGIVSHSVIIGLSLGVSQSPCTIRPLIAALSFHQFFEGFALGGCISQAQFKNMSVALMACFFAITTPMGIAAGAGISSVYNANSPRALVVEGILDSTSAGILIYMALVDLIAADFLGRQMSCNVRLQVASYVTLLLGALSMSALAIWA